MGIGSTLRRMLGGNDGEQGTSPDEDVEFEFEAKNVNEAEEYQLCYYGTYRYEDDDGREHLVGREFEVYTEEDDRVDGMPLAHVREVHSVDDAEDDEHGGREFEVPVEVDPELQGIALKSRVKAFLDRWNRDHVDRY